MKKIIGVVKDFFADFKDFWFLLKPQFKYGGAYYRWGTTFFGYIFTR